MIKKTIWLLSLFWMCEGELPASSYVNPPFVVIQGQTSAQEKPQLLLYYTPWCPSSQRVLDSLKRIHKTVPMKNIQNDTKGKEELKKAGGKLQVPCLIIDDKALYESEAIVLWLSNHKQLLDPS